MQFGASNRPLCFGRCETHKFLSERKRGAKNVVSSHKIKLKINSLIISNIMQVPKCSKPCSLWKLFTKLSGFACKLGKRLFPYRGHYLNATFGSEPASDPHPLSSLPIPDFGPGGTVQRAEQPLRPRRGLPPAKENRRVRCQVGDFGTLASLMGRTLKGDLSRVTETRVRRGIMYPTLSLPSSSSDVRPVYHAEFG